MLDVRTEFVFAVWSVSPPGRFAFGYDDGEMVMERNVARQRWVSSVLSGSPARAVPDEVGRSDSPSAGQLPLFPGSVVPSVDPPMPDELDDTLPSGDFPGQLLLDLGLALGLGLGSA